MNYEFWFWITIAFVAGKLSSMKFYIGPDERKYKEADFAILRKK